MFLLLLPGSEMTAEEKVPVTHCWVHLVVAPMQSVMKEKKVMTFPQGVASMWPGSECLILRDYVANVHQK